MIEPLCWQADGGKVNGLSPLFLRSHDALEVVEQHVGFQLVIMNGAIVRLKLGDVVLLFSVAGM